MKVKIVAWHEDFATCKVQLLSQQCENCVGSCGLPSAGKPRRTKELWVNNSVKKFARGDTAELLVSSRALILAAAIVFVIPLAFLFLPVAVASFLELSEKLLFVVAGVGLTAGLGISVIYGAMLDWSKLFDLQLNPIGNRSEP